MREVEAKSQMLGQISLKRHLVALAKEMNEAVGRGGCDVPVEAESRPLLDDRRAGGLAVPAHF